MSTEVDEILCGECGIQFAVPQRRLNARREDGRTFYYPNGHPRAFRVSTVDTLCAERDRLQQRLVTSEEELRRERLARERTEKAAATRRKSRKGSNVVQLRRAK